MVNHSNKDLSLYYFRVTHKKKTNFKENYDQLQQFEADLPLVNYLIVKLAITLLI